LSAAASRAVEAVPVAPALPYDATTVRLHWATAALVLLLWGTAQCIDYFPKGAPRWNARSVHMLLGLVLAVVLVWRIRWRASAGRRLPALGSPGLRLAGVGMHRLLYLLLVAVVALGVLNAWVRGDHVFQLFEIAPLDAGNKALRQTVGTLHEYGANAILTLAGLHALAALFHHYVLRDGLLDRMRLRVRQRPPTR
jgi:cytochrome b561